MPSKLKDASQRNSVKTRQDNFELQRKWRNEATKERRKAIKQYWKKVSDNVMSDPRKFYRTFRPFTDFKNKQGNSGGICLKVKDVLEGDQTKVANHFANFFSTMAD